jgi:hypothetical protein
MLCKTSFQDYCEVRSNLLIRNLNAIDNEISRNEPLNDKNKLKKK